MGGCALRKRWRWGEWCTRWLVVQAVALTKPPSPTLAGVVRLGRWKVWRLKAGCKGGWDRKGQGTCPPPLTPLAFVA